MAEPSQVDRLGNIEHCDGSRECPASEHIHGCFAERPYRTAIRAGRGWVLKEDADALRDQLAGAVADRGALLAAVHANLHRPATPPEICDLCAALTKQLPSTTGGQ